MVREHFDVVIVGAGLSGVGAAYRLQTQCPSKRFVILEGRARMGGTWDLFRYPGVRSDSDMFTLGYPFRPWDQERAIAEGPAILRYIEETAAANGIDGKIRYSQRVHAASWSSAEAAWSVDVVREDTGETIGYTCNFLYLCSGYYRYDQGHRPEFPGERRFRGPIVHPQAWPRDLDYTGKRVVVIGSGATAVTLVPAMAATAEHVTMLQRSPTYIAALPAVDPLARLLRRALPPGLAHRAARWKSIVLTLGFYQLSRRRPETVKRLLRASARAALPDGYPIDPDFVPRYQPWDQRLCVVPDGDLFRVLREGRASIVTDQVETFTEHGLRLQSGQQLEADVVVSATGLQLQACGGIDFRVDGSPVELGERFVYRGVMLSGVPNAAMCIGYTNASWTLRADLTSQYVCRLLNHLDRIGASVATPELADSDIRARPLLDLTSGYVQRSAAHFPKQGSADPWLLRQNYVLDFLTARFSDVTECMTFSRAGDLPAPVEREHAAV